MQGPEPASACREDLMWLATCLACVATVATAYGGCVVCGDNSGSSMLLSLAREGGAVRVSFFFLQIAPRRELGRCDSGHEDRGM